MRRRTRREFIADSALMLGATVGTMALGPGVFSPQKAEAADINFLESTCTPQKQIKKKILVTYASFCGSTGGVAEAIGEVLCGKGALVDIRLIKNVTDISGYQAVVVGSAVRSSSWWPEAIEFVEKNQKTLRQLPVAYFLTCLALYKDNQGSRKVVQSYMDPVLKAAPAVKPFDMGFFAGALDYSKLSFVYRMVMKSKMKKQGVPEGDFRNWQAIRAWAHGLDGSIMRVLPLN